MDIRIVTGKTLKIPKNKTIDIVRDSIANYLKIKPEEIISIEGIDDVVVTKGSVTYETLSDEELLNNSVKQILKKKGYNLRGANIEVLNKEEKGK